MPDTNDLDDSCCQWLNGAYVQSTQLFHLSWGRTYSRQKWEVRSGGLIKAPDADIQIWFVAEPDLPGCYYVATRSDPKVSVFAFAIQNNDGNPIQWKTGVPDFLKKIFL